MLSVNNDICSMCHDHQRCGLCCLEVQTKLTENELKWEREMMGSGRGLNTFLADAALHLTAPEEPQPAAQSLHAEPLGHGHAEPHRSPLTWSEPYSSSLSWSEPHRSLVPWSAEPHPHELPSGFSQLAELSDNSGTLLSPSFLGGYHLDTFIPPIDRRVPPSLNASQGHPLATTHWFPDPVQPAAENPENTPAADRQALFTAPTPSTKRLDTQEADQDKEEDKLFFACPFWKRNPHHTWSSSRSCCSNYRRIGDVKQHINRNHSAQHLTDKTKRRNQGLSGGLDELQLDELNTYSDRTATKREQWFVIWDIAFPNLPRPVSPYVNHDLLGELDEYQEYTLTRESDSLPALSPEIATPAQTPQEILQTPGTSFGNLPWFKDSLSLTEDMSADMYDMGSLDCELDPASWQLLCGHEMTLRGDSGSLSPYPDSIPAYMEQANVPLFFLAPDPNIFPYPYS